jgi:hypothetical protein
MCICICIQGVGRSVRLHHQRIARGSSQVFYTKIAGLFAPGRLGGVIITARKP